MSQQIDLGIEGLTNYQEVGRGGFAVVYAAEQTAFSRWVAVKVLDAVDDVGLRRFNREQAALGSVAQHPNVVTPFSSGFTRPDGKPYLVMEYLPGGSLQGRIDQDGPLDVFGAIELVLPIADALGHSHRSGIVHKDVKPANILVSATGEAKLTDFGIAALQASTSTTALSYSLAYSAPETFGKNERGGDDPRDGRSDLYSLAATLFALITGRDPFFDPGNHTFAGYMARILQDPVPPCGHGQLDTFFATALAKDPNHRYPTATQFISALQEAAYDSSMVTRPRSSTGPRPERWSTTDSRPVSGRRPARRWIVGVAAVLLLGAAAGLGFRLLGANDDQEAANVELRSATAIFGGHTDSVRALLELHDGDIVSASNDATVQRWDPDNPEAEAIAYTGHTGPVRSLVLLGDGRIASASRDGTAHVWDPDDPEAEAVVYRGHGAEVESIAVLADGRIVTASFDETVHVWNPDAPEADPVVYRGHGTTVEAVTTLADGRIASAGNDQAVHLWHPDTPDAQPELYTGHTGSVEFLTQLSDGRIASAGNDEAVHVWDPDATGRQGVVFALHVAGVEAVAELADGRLASAGDDDTVRIWRVEDPDVQLIIYQGHTIDVEAVIQLSDGRMVSGSTDTTVHIWELS